MFDFTSWISDSSKAFCRSGCDLANVYFVIDEYTDVAEPGAAARICDIVMDVLKNPCKPPIPTIRRAYKYQTSSIDEVFHGLGQKDDLKLLRIRSPLIVSLSTFFLWIYSLELARESTSTFLTNAYLSPEPLSSIWVLGIYLHRFDFLGHMCLKFFNSATISLLDDSLTFVHAGNPMINSLNRASIPPLSPTSSVLPCPSSFASPLFFFLLIALFSSSCARTRDSKTHFMCPLIQRLHFL